MRWRTITLATFTLWTLCVDMCLSADLLPSENRRPNILWIMAEDISTELGCYGHPAVKTPMLDGLARQGARYKNAFCTAPSCTPSRNAMMTGVYQTRTDTQDQRRRGVVLPKGMKPITHWLQSAGYYAALGCGYRECAYVQNNRPMLPVIRELHAQGKLNEAQQLLLSDVKPAEELYDLQADPYELDNLAPSAEHRTTLKELRTLLDGWIADTNDKGLEHLEATEDRGEPQISEIDVDKVWVANQVGFALQTVGRRQYVAYYDRNRMMTVACRDIDSRQWQKTTLPSKLMWDSHNRVVLAVDRSGYVHVSGNMHTHPLCYFRSEKPHDISRMIACHRMIGKDEESVTYPRFFCDNAGRLLFSYRSGTCGNGNILVNRFEPEHQRWVRHLDTPLFEGIEADDDRAAYHRFVKDAEGHFHFVWMWRWTPAVETCHQLCYATSPDLIHWKNAAGKTVALPFRPDTQDVIVDDAPSKGGLHNSRYQIIVDLGGRPLIGYVKYDQRGLTQLYVAKHDGKQWVSKQVSNWDFRWKFFEGGDQMTRGGSFSLAGISEEEILVIPWSTEKGDSGKYALDIETLEPVTTAATIESVYPEVVHKRLSEDPSLSVNLCSDSGGAQAGGVRYLLKWESRGQSHGKHAPDVIPEGPVSKLVVVKIQ